jgi:hypothetical protein
LQHAVDSVEFEARPGRHVLLGISIGAAIFPHDGDSYESLLATADSRMYRDKTRRKQERAQGTGPPAPGSNLQDSGLTAQGPRPPASVSSQPM